MVPDLADANPMEDYDAPLDWEPEVPQLPTEPADILTMREKSRFKGVLAEILRRKSEALRLFTAIPEQERFFASDADERLAIGGNRGGKTTTTMVEIARAVTGQDPYDKYPATDGIFILVAIDLSKCAKVFYRKLFMPGAFKIIKDLATNEWRTFRPAIDSDRFDEAKAAPPLIPQRFIKSISWENKKELTPKTVHLKNGWELWFYSSGGEIPQGVDVDGVAFDEEIAHANWYTEMAARLADRRQKNTTTGKVKSGKFLWGATPQSGTIQLYDLKGRADDERAAEIALMARGEPLPPPKIECFLFGMLDNEFLPQHAKDALIAKYADMPEEYRVRVLGQFALMGMRVYSEFAPKGVHACKSFLIPDDWTRYISVDPGHQVCAVLFAACPPPNHPMHGQKILYDELYLKKCNAAIFAEALRQKVAGTGYYAQIIDHRAGRQTDMGSGRTHEEQFSHALRLAKVSCERTGHHFTWGSDDVKGGIEAVRQGLHVIDGRSEWVVMEGKCPMLLWEAERYSYRKLPNGMVTDEPLKNTSDHLMDAWRYLAMGNLRYVKGRPKKARLGYTGEAIKRKKERAAAKNQDNGSILIG